MAPVDAMINSLSKKNSAIMEGRERPRGEMEMMTMMATMTVRWPRELEGNGNEDCCLLPAFHKGKLLLFQCCRGHKDLWEVNVLDDCVY